MATRSDLQLNNVVFITDLASSSNRSSPHPAIGKVVDFIDLKHRSQAVVLYHGGEVNRSVGKLVRIVKSGEIICEKRQSICPLSQADEDIQAAWKEEDEGEEGELPQALDVPGGRDQVDEQDVRGHLPGVPDVLAGKDQVDEQDVRGHLPGAQPGVRLPPLPLPPP